MATAIIGIGNIRGTLARQLVRGGESVVLAAKDEAKAAALAQELGDLSRAASVEEAIADSLASAANREPRRAVLFYATDDDVAAAAIERLISAAGFDPLKVGGVAEAGRIEVPGGDLHQSGMNGQLLDLDQARPAVAAGPTPATT
jgi:predicted dinucleotide-binding enzyme